MTAKKRRPRKDAKGRQVRRRDASGPLPSEPQPDQVAIFNALGPSVGFALRGVLEDSDPRATYPGVYDLIFGKVWPEEPGPKALTRTHLREMARDVRDAVKRLHRRLLGRFRDLEQAIRGTGLETVTQYRVWLAVRFLVDRQGHSEAVAAFRQSARRLVSDRSRRQILDSVEHLRRAMEAVPKNSPRVPLPGIAFGWPPQLRQLANDLVQLHDLDSIVKQHVESAEVRLICEEMPQDQSSVRDPVVHVAIRALDRVLELDKTRPTARSRRELIGRILDALYPKAYRSDAHPFGPHDPRGKWSDRSIRQHVDTPTAMEEIIKEPPLQLEQE